MHLDERVSDVEEYGDRIGYIVERTDAKGLEKRLVVSR